MLKIIINGDDYGKSHRVNRAIAECFEKGFISSATLMVNMPYADEAVYMAQKYGYFDKIGLHLNLTEGEPLKSKKNGRLFSNGQFNKLLISDPIARFILTKAERESIRDEIKCQIEKYLSYGLKAIHIDSHHHVHTNYSVFHILGPLLRTYGFQSMRLSLNINKEEHNVAKKWYKAWFNHMVKSIMPCSADFFCGFDQLLTYEKIHQLTGVAELMCHPDFIDNTRNNLTNLGVKEQASADYNYILHYIHKDRLISYHDLCKGK